MRVIYFEFTSESHQVLKKHAMDIQSQKAPPHIFLCKLALVHLGVFVTNRFKSSSISVKNITLQNRINKQQHQES